MLQELETQVLGLYQKADRAVAGYRAASGISCPSGCVQCCHSEKVEATVLEMVPLAFHLFRTNQAELLIKRLEREELPDNCVLFRPDLTGSLGGGCSQYHHRALVCRLFGFAGNHDRNGDVQLALCRIMKECGELPSGGLNGAELPVFQEYGIAVTAMHPSLGERRMPINLALLQALLKVGLLLDLEAPRPAVGSTDSPNDTPSIPPFTPRRRAA